MIRSIATRIAVCAVVIFAFATLSRAQVKPGDHINAQNAALVKDLVSPGTYFAVTKGMGMEIVAPKRVEWPPPYKIATEQYSSQVRLSQDHRTVLGYVAGQPFPLLDMNDPDIATKIMWDSDFRPIATDDADLRFFECQVTQFNPGGPQKLENQAELGHVGGYYEIGRTEVEPLPADPDFKKTGIWWRAGAYPVISPAEGRGSGGIRYRYWDPDRGDDAWAFLNTTRRVRRVNETILSSSPGLTTWDPDHAGGFSAKPQEYNYKFLGERNMLGVVHAKTSPEHPCPTDGQSTACNEDWEMRHLYVIEVTPRPEKTSQILQSKTIVYIDGEFGSILTSTATTSAANCGGPRFIFRPIVIAQCPTRRLRSIRSSANSSWRRRVSMCRPARSRPATFRAPTLRNASAGTSTWVRSIASSSLPTQW